MVLLIVVITPSFFIRERRRMLSVRSLQSLTQNKNPQPKARELRPPGSAALLAGPSFGPVASSLAPFSSKSNYKVRANSI